MGSLVAHRGFAGESQMDVSPVRLPRNFLKLCCEPCGVSLSRGEVEKKPRRDKRSDGM